MTTFDEARANRIAAATLQEWRDLLADMLDEMKAFDDAVESKAIRYVKTPAGARKYGEPIGAPIRPGGPKLDYTRKGPKKRASAPSSDAGSDRESPTKPRIDYTRKTPKAPSKPEPARPGDREDSSREQAFAPGTDPKTVEPKKLTDNSLDQQVAAFAKTPPKDAAERARATALVTELNRRRVADGKKPESNSEPVTPARNAGPDLSQDRLGNLTDRGLKKEEARLSKIKRRSQAETTRLLQVRIQINRRAAAAANAQARGLGRLKLPGQKSADFVDYRFEVDAKAFALVGDGDWDCSEMEDDDIEFFLAKSLRGRPTVEKLQMANSLLTERVARVEVDEPEVKELAWEPA